MNLADQLKLQAFLDGELSPTEAQEVSGWIQRDPAAAALLEELEGTRQQLRQMDQSIVVPASREFYWSKIKRDLEQPAHIEAVRSQSGRFNWLRLLILPSAVVVVLVIAGLSMHFHAPPSVHTDAANAETPSVETSLASTSATTYRDASEGTTLVWFTDTAASSLAVGSKPPRAN